MSDTVHGLADIGQPVYGVTMTTDTPDLALQRARVRNAAARLRADVHAHGAPDRNLAERLQTETDYLAHLTDQDPDAEHILSLLNLTAA